MHASFRSAWVTSHHNNSYFMDFDVKKQRILCNATVGTYVLKAICLQVVNFDMDGVKSSCAQSSVLFRTSFKLQGLQHIWRFRSLVITLPCEQNIMFNSFLFVYFLSNGAIQLTGMQIQWTATIEKMSTVDTLSIIRYNHLNSRHLLDSFLKLMVELTFENDTEAMKMSQHI